MVKLSTDRDVIRPHTRSNGRRRLDRFIAAVVLVGTLACGSVGAAADADPVAIPDGAIVALIDGTVDNEGPSSSKRRGNWSTQACEPCSPDEGRLDANSSDSGDGDWADESRASHPQRHGTFRPPCDDAAINPPPPVDLNTRSLRAPPR
jgi:hypothetical protein